MDPRFIGPEAWAEISVFVTNIWLFVVSIIIFASNMLIGHNAIPSLVTSRHLSSSWLKIRPPIYGVAVIAFGAAQMGILNPFNRKQESEADYLGLIFSSLSGYDIRETVGVWERMKEANKGKTPPEFMSTHPSPDNRIKKINEWMNEVILKYPPIKSN